MPTYDYRCPHCQNLFSVFMSFADYGKKKVACPACGRAGARRRIGRVRIAKSEERRMDDLSDPSFLDGVDENDPKSIARAMRKMGREMGEDLPPEFGEITDRLEAGEDPESIEKSMPDLGEAAGGDSLGDDY